MPDVGFLQPLRRRPRRVRRAARCSGSRRGCASPGRCSRSSPAWSSGRPSSDGWTPTCRSGCSPSSGSRSCSSWRASRSTSPSCAAARSWSPSLGFGITLVLGVLAGVLFAAVGWVHSPLLLAVTLSATSLGLIVPVLKDAGQTETARSARPWSSRPRSPTSARCCCSPCSSPRAPAPAPAAALVLLVGFALLVAVLAWALLRGGRSPRLGDALLRQQDTTAESGCGPASRCCSGSSPSPSRFGLETILGAFVAGAVLAFVDRDAMSHPRLRAKLDAVGYGFVVPVFFVASGLQLDVRGLLADPSALRAGAGVPRRSARRPRRRGPPRCCRQRAAGRPPPPGCCRRRRCPSS